MPWTDLYTTVLITECVGNALSTFNANFENIDSYLRDLSAILMPNTSVLAEIAAQGTTAKATARTNLGLGSIATLGSNIVASAWCNFNGDVLALTTLTGTYTRDTNGILTVDIVDHDLMEGDFVYLDFSSGSITDKTVIVEGILSVDSFSAYDANNNTFGGTGPITGSPLSGDVSFQYADIRAEYNVRKVIRVRDVTPYRESFAVHYTTDLSTSNYAVLCTGRGSGGTSSVNNQSVGCGYYNTRLFVATIYSDNYLEDSDHVHCAVFS